MKSLRFLAATWVFCALFATGIQSASAFSFSEELSKLQQTLESIQEVLAAAVSSTDGQSAQVIGSTSVSGSTATTAPALTLTVTPTALTLGNKAAIKWSASNVRTCTASGAWTGTKLLSGTISTGIFAVTGTRNYTLTCTGTNGTIARTVTVTVAATSTPSTGVISPSTTRSCTSDGQTYQEGATLQTIVNPNGTRQTVMDASFVCRSGQWVTEGSLPSVPRRCTNGNQTYVEGDRLQSILNPDGTTRTVMDASFVCRSGQWVTEGSLPRVSTTTLVRVTTTNNVNVRSTPNGLSLGTKVSGSLGYRAAASVTAGGHQWVYVNFDTNPDGYVAAQYLSTTIPGTPPTVGGMTREQIVARLQELQAEVVRLQALLSQM